MRRMERSRAQRALEALGCALLASSVPVPGSTFAPATGQGPLAIGVGCEDCHPGVVESYRRTPMARALEPLAEGEVRLLAELSAESIPIGEAGLAYGFEQEGSRALLVERSLGDQVEREIGRWPVAFAVGAGELDRSYAVELGSALYFAPLEKLSAGSRGASAEHLAPAPGHSILPTLRLQSPIGDECLSCHTDALPPKRVPHHAVPEQAWLPQGIGCGACHGDVEAHARWREDALVGKDPGGADPVLRPQSMAWRERLSVCGRCHLQGDSRLSLERGRRALAPPGTDFLASTAVFVAAEDRDEIGFVSHFERLLESDCFLVSPRGALACETCHDPHRSMTDPLVRQHARQACSTCHALEAAEARRAAPSCSLERAQWPVGKDCVSCHMRLTPVFDLEGIAVHDHWIRARPPAASRFQSIRVKQSEGRELRRMAWPGESAPLAEDPGLWMVGLAAAGQREAARGLVDRKPDLRVERLNVYQHTRGSLLEELGRFEDARVAYERSRLLDPDWSESTVNLAGVLLELGRPADAVARLDALLARWPLVKGAWQNRAASKLALGDWAGARADLERAYGLAPLAANARALGEIARRAGDAAAVQRWESEAKRLEP